MVSSKTGKSEPLTASLVANAVASRLAASPVAARLTTSSIASAVAERIAASPGARRITNPLTASTVASAVASRVQRHTPQMGRSRSVGASPLAGSTASPLVSAVASAVAQGIHEIVGEDTIPLKRPEDSDIVVGTVASAVQNAVASALSSLVKSASDEIDTNRESQKAKSAKSKTKK